MAGPEDMTEAWGEETEPGGPLIRSPSVHFPLDATDPRQLGPYRIQVRLVPGQTRGWGRPMVFLANSPHGDRVVVKAAHREAGWAAAERLYREAANASRVRSPQVAKVLRAPVEDGPYSYIVQEFIAGTPLDVLLRTRPDARLKAVDSIRLAQGLLRALRAMSAAGVTHRDIKPSNIILAPHGPVVIDFEISHHADDDRITSQGRGQSGTPRYMSPEQFDGSSLSPAIDLFGWGVTVVEAATGHHPFAPPGRTADWPVVNRSGRPNLADAPVVMIPLLQTALNPDPVKRNNVDYLEKHLAGDVSDVLTAPQGAVPLPPESQRGPIVGALADEVIEQAQEWINHAGQVRGTTRGIVARFEDRITDNSGWLALACAGAVALGLLTATVLRIIVTVMSG